MLALLFISLSLLVYTACGCPRSKKDDCFSENLGAFPRTVSDIEEDCRVVPDVFECFANVTEECDPDYDEWKWWREMKEKLILACDEDSPLLKGVKENIECIHNSGEQALRLCLERPGEGGTDPMEYICPMVADHFEECNDNEVYGDDRACITDLFQASCASLITSIVCGDEVADIAFEVFDILSIGTKRCSPEVREQMETLRGDFYDALKAEGEFMNSIDRESSSNEN